MGVQDIFGGVFKSTELSATLTEIVKIDPTFEREKFLKECESDIIPNVLEAITRGDLEILEDWCYEAPFNVLATPIRQAKTMGLVISSRVLDIDSLDLAMGKMMEQGPVLVITFNSQQILCVKDRDGKVVEGSEDKVMRVAYVWVLCRDQSELILKRPGGFLTSRRTAKSSSSSLPQLRSSLSAGLTVLRKLCSVQNLPGMFCHHLECCVQ